MEQTIPIFYERTDHSEPKKRFMAYWEAYCEVLAEKAAKGEQEQ